MLTYLELINEVLIRLRENTVSSPTENLYSKVIARFVNDVKRQVEDSWNWNALRNYIEVTTSAGTSTYNLVGSGRRSKVLAAHNVTSQSVAIELQNAPIQWILNQQRIFNLERGQPVYWAIGGRSSDSTTNDVKVELWQIPDGTYTVGFDTITPQADLSASGDVMYVQSDVVIQGAYARALAERGEDGGLNSSEAQAIYKSMLADAIAVESSQFIENECWIPA